MNKVLVVVYSWTGTSRRLAESLALSQQWTLAQVQDAKAGRRDLSCILDSLLRRRPAITYDGPDPAAFDAVVLVSPIWAYSLAGPMRSFVARYGKAFRDVVVVSVMGNRGAPNAQAEITRLIGRQPLLSAAFTSREVEEGSHAARIEAIGRAIQDEQDRSAGALRPSIWSPSSA